MHLPTTYLPTHPDVNEQEWFLDKFVMNPIPSYAMGCYDVFGLRTPKDTVRCLFIEHIAFPSTIKTKKGAEKECCRKCVK
jgi:hypothetical protein